MEAVILKPVYHRAQECIGIYFSKNAIIQSLIQKHVGARWSKTCACWYAPLSKGSYEELVHALKGKAILHDDDLKQHPLIKKVIQPSIMPGNSLAIAGTAKKPEQYRAPVQQVTLLTLLSKENKEALQQFKQQLILKSYSPSTIKTYTNEFIQFLNTIKEKPAVNLPLRE
jgi:hypothetical protein